MIERYFVKGAKFSWAKPGDVPSNNDGTVVANGSAAPPALTFIGWDDEIPYGPQAPTLGLHAGFAIPYHWLSYVLGRTAYVEPAGADVLTGFMSGCWICKWGVPVTLTRRVGHIGTVDTVPRDQAPNTTVKTAFANSVGVNGLGLTGYSPANAFGFDEISKVQKQAKSFLNPHVMSLVTSQDQFYSILMMDRAGHPNVYVCGGKKAVTASQRADVLLALQ